MAETDYAALEAKSSGDRTVMHVLYGLHTIAPFSAWTLAVIALIVNFIKRSDELDALYASHHTYMIVTFWWTLLWLALAGMLTMAMVLTILLIPIAWVPFAAVGIWYLYRCIRGWLRFNDNRPPR